MNVIIFGASGMDGAGALRECLADPRVGRVLNVGRSAAGEVHPKLRELVHADLYDYSTIEADLRGYDACFFCLGVSSAAMTEAAYRRVTFDLTLAAAKTLVRLNPAMTFLYVSGASTDSTGAGRTMWARVKGQTENALLALPFKASYMLRPAIIMPLHGIRSKTKSYRLIYGVLGPLLPALRALFPNHITTTEQLGRVMLRLTEVGYAKRVLEVRDIAAVAATVTGPS
jgi:uncharacterized protein YbjT (DUF2867 family)